MIIHKGDPSAPLAPLACACNFTLMVVAAEISVAVRA
jgi:hypothetical protein